MIVNKSIESYKLNRYTNDFLRPLTTAEVDDIE
jgi:hypothetical protein